IRDSSVTGVQTCALPIYVRAGQVPTDPPVLVLGLSRSLSGPHMVTFQKNGKIWARSEVGKYQPDVPEIRRMFLESNAWLAECERSEERRVGKDSGCRRAP